MRVLFHDTQQLMPLGMATPASSLNQLLAEADFVSLHVPETDDTRGLIGAAELAQMLMKKGLSETTARNAVEEIHEDEDEAIAIHLSHEIGVQPGHRPSAIVAAVSSFLMFAIGAVVPLIPYLLGLGSLPIGLAFGGVGLLIAGALAAHFTKQPRWLGALRQLLFGAIAVGATYLIGDLIGATVS